MAGAVKLELRCPKKVDGIAVDPEPDWNFSTLLSEINSLEEKLSVSSKFPLAFAKTKSRDIYHGKSIERNSRAFIMRVSVDEMEESSQSLTVAKRFHCDDIYLSDDSEDESLFELQSDLMNEVVAEEGALYEVNYEHHIDIKEEIRIQVSAFETDIIKEIETSNSAFARVEKYKEARREMDRKLDLQYQRKVAEALDNHLTAVQRDHELKSQIEERRIRSDAAYEEAKRREKALQEEKLRQEKVKAEAEAKLRAEEAKRVALEAEKKAAKEAAEREAAEASKRIAGGVPPLEGDSSEAVNAPPKGSGSKKPQLAGNLLRSAENALKLEEQRQQKLKELDEVNKSLKSCSNEDFSSFERHIGRLVRQIRGTRDNVSGKASEIIKILNNPRCPQSISVAAFVKKVVSHCEAPDNAPFASSYVIVLVTSQFPHAMDLLLAEFHGACIYTVPKHIVYKKSEFESKEAYYKAIGYRENDGQIESTNDYLKRLESYMKLYGALVQAEVNGIRNLHGLEAGWAWLARFLNTAPANMYTAVALNTFLQMAGFGLFRKYKSQFNKILEIISGNFLSALKAREEPGLKPVIAEIQAYLEDKKFIIEPEGRSLQNYLLSSVMVPSESDY
ncbi:protein GLE1 isoform X3 [Carica papaya]|uniref:protein GLE1 isoform X3 n=1 Tax=Carica papaya TaxID=3649 RepID=UPI000B8CF3F4|nr:protein GLE1 isoform X3 [Carica papaya]